MNVTERFWPKVNLAGSGGCWLWTASRTGDGYGIFNYGGRAGRAHRFAYELLVGPIPDGLQLDHLCRVRHCVNPEHLEAVTQQENIRRGEGIQVVNARKTHCPQGHPYSGANLYVDPSGRRRCLACQDAATKNRWGRVAAR